MYLKNIENQTKDICLAAVKQNGYALIYVKNQTEEICLAAVQKTGLALKYVKEQTHKICLAAINENVSALEYVREQNFEICMEAIKLNIHALMHIRNISAEIAEEAVKINGTALQYIPYPSFEISKIAVKQNIYSIKYVKSKFLNEICHSLNILYLPSNKNHKSLILKLINGEYRCWLDSKENISIRELVSIIHDKNDDELFKNSPKKYYLRFLKKHKLYSRKKYYVDKILKIQKI